jgi:hypothetical protein
MKTNPWNEEYRESFVLQSIDGKGAGLKGWKRTITNHRFRM